MAVVLYLKQDPPQQEATTIQELSVGSGTNKRISAIPHEVLDWVETQKGRNLFCWK